MSAQKFNQGLQDFRKAVKRLQIAVTRAAIKLRELDRQLTIQRHIDSGELER